MKKEIQVTVLGLCGNSVFLALDHFHRPGETVSATGLYNEPGGKGYNQAVAAARLGAKVAFLGAIGGDLDGKMCMDFLEGEGILPLPQVYPELRSAYACILIDRHGENRVSVFRGAADLLTPEFIESQEETIAQSRFLLLNNEYPQECNEMAMALAKKHGVRVIYNPAPQRAVSPEFLAGCYLLTPNLSETAALLGLQAQSLEELAAAIRNSGLSNVIVTLGGDGALLVTREKALHYPGLCVRAADTTGAGDTFTAGVCAGLLQGLSLEKAAEQGINASGLSVTKQYVMPSLPTGEELAANYQTISPITISFGR